MGRQKVFPDGQRICINCGSEESDDCPFMLKENCCKRCKQDYNTDYQRNKRGHKPRSERLSPEEARRRKVERTRQWRLKRENVKKSRSSEEEAQLRIEKLLVEAEEYRDL